MVRSNSVFLACVVRYHNNKPLTVSSKRKRNYAVTIQVGRDGICSKLSSRSLYFAKLMEMYEILSQMCFFFEK